MTLTLSEAGQNAVAGTFGRAMKRAGEALGSMSGQVIEVQTPMLRRCSAADVLTMAGGPEEATETAAGGGLGDGDDTPVVEPRSDKVSLEPDPEEASTSARVS